MRLIVMLFFLPTLLLAQNSDFAWTNQNVAHYLPAFYSSFGSGESNFEKLQCHVEKLSHRKGSYKDEISFLQHIFSKTEQRFLKEYRTTTTFDQIFSNGVYNCLTGTALFALVLDHFDYNYQIIETNYHIFLTVSIGDRQVLIETTDHLNGFVTDPKAIAERISSYRLGNSATASSDEKVYFRYKASLYNSISLENILGLLQFNLAVDSYNHHDVRSSIGYLLSAYTFYNSERIEEFSRIIVLTILEGKFSIAEKNEMLAKLKSIKRNDSMVFSRVD